jgi:hypothetical protein
VVEVEDDGEIPGMDDPEEGKGEKKMEWCTLERVADAQPLEIVNYIGVIHKLGQVGSVTTKTGIQKMRRNVIVVDDSNLSCVVCFWSERHLESDQYK